MKNYICGFEDDGKVIPYGHGKSLEYAVSLLDGGYPYGFPVKLYKLVEVDIEKAKEAVKKGETEV